MAELISVKITPEANRMAKVIAAEKGTTVYQIIEAAVRRQYESLNSKQANGKKK